MLNIHRQNGKSKTVSSYMLSGLNIRKMLADQTALPQDLANISDISIIKMNKHRPIFKIKIKQKQEEQAGSQMPNKTFKIRSFTKKLRNQCAVQGTGNAQIFQKVENLRNIRSINNRIELFNLSAMPKLNRTECRDHGQVREGKSAKVCEVYRREGTVRCRVGSQIFIKEATGKFEELAQSGKDKDDKKCLLEYGRCNTERYRELANKISVSINENYQQEENSILVILSLDSVHINSKKAGKSNGYMIQQFGKMQKAKGKFSQQTMQIIKLFSKKNYPLDFTNCKIKIALKVNNLTQLEQLRAKLEINQIDDYFCIFYPVHRYIETWNLYLIQPLIKYSRQLILIQSQHQLRYQFPIINSNISTLFVATQNQNFLSLTRTARAIKCFLHFRPHNSESNSTSLQMNYNQIFPNNQSNLIKATSLNDFNCLQINSYSINFQINVAQLQAKLKFTSESRQFKNKKMGKNGKINSSCSKRRVLCERSNNIPNFSINDFNRDEKKSHNKSKGVIEMSSIEQIGTNLISEFRLAAQYQRPAHISINLKGPYCISKNEELDQITNCVRGTYCKSKAIHQVIAQLTRKNEHIHKQISSYIEDIAQIQSLLQNNGHLYSIYSQQSKELMGGIKDGIEEINFTLYRIQ